MLLVLLLLYLSALAIHRLYLHPLRRFPGPRCAALTSLYEFYFNAIQGGQYIWQIEQMHRQYGPIVRITPNELHISDPSFYNAIYTGRSHRRDKAAHFVRLFGAPTAAIATVDHDLHASRRRILAGFFSRRSIVALEDRIQAKVNRLCRRLHDAGAAGAVVPLDAALSALATDTITEYSYGASWGALDSPHWASEIHESIRSLLQMGPLLQAAPWALPLVESMPRWLLQRVHPAAANVLAMKSEVRAQSEHSLEMQGTDPRPEKRTIFDALIDPDVPPEERSLARLVDEGTVLLGAGIETTASVMAAIVFNLLWNKGTWIRLREELQRHPQATTWTDLEKLPYLRGVVYEGLRLFTAVMARLPRRIADAEGLRYGAWVIPAGTLVSSTSYFVHMDEDLFPRPNVFDPDRWADEQGFESLVAFTKGSRQCVGLNLAMAELYLVTAGLVRRVDMELFETKEEDMRPVRDYGVGFPKEKNAGLRVVVKSRE